MTMTLDEIGNRENKKKATFSINQDLLADFKKIAKNQKKKLSPIIEDLIKIYVEQEKSLIKN
jgi:metal-responsive CopG/Arc/MetJ family transcriptional regulator